MKNRYHLTKKEIAKLKLDTGGGCSVCGSTPVVHVDGSYWVCGGCVLEDSITQYAMRELLTEEQIKAVYERAVAWGTP